MRDTALVVFVVQCSVLLLQCSSVQFNVECGWRAVVHLYLYFCSTVCSTVTIQCNVECGWRAVVHERRHQWSRGRRPEQLDHTCPTNRATVKIRICESLSLWICEFVTFGISVFVSMSSVF